MLIRGDSNLLDSRPIHVRVAKRMVLGRWIPRFERYLTVGKLNEDYYEFYGADRSKFFPVRHFVENKRFAEQAETARSRQRELRRKRNLRSDSMVFLFVGKFIDKKRPMDLIHAAERLSAKGVNIDVLMVGDGILRSDCETYAARKALPISFTGFLNQSEIAEAYGCAHVLVLPSGYAETWGLVVNEAMSCGLPAIVSDHVGCGPDLVKQHETGMVFPAGNVSELAESMEFYARHQPLVQSHGENARRRMRNYTVEEATENTLSAVLSVSAPRVTQRRAFELIPESDLTTRRHAK